MELLGDLALVSRISVGGYAESFLARDVRIPDAAPVVVKRWLAHMLDDDAERVRCDLERAAFDYEGGVGWLRRPYLPGLLVEHLRGGCRALGQRPPPSLVAGILADAAGGLAAAWRRSGRPLRYKSSDAICGWDARATVIAAEPVGGVPPVHAGRLSVRWLTPEEIRGEPFDERSAVFCIGIGLFELATTEVAFGGESEFRTLERIRAGERPPTPVELHEGLGAVIDRALSPEPDQRFSTLASVSDALRDLTQADRSAEIAWLAANFLKRQQTEERQLSYLAQADLPPPIGGIELLKTTRPGEGVVASQAALRAAAREFHDCPALVERWVAPSARAWVAIEPEEGRREAWLYRVDEDGFCERELIGRAPISLET